MLQLRIERQRRGWTLAKLSAFSGIAAPDLTKLELEQKRAFPGWRRRLALVFQVPESELFRKVDPTELKVTRTANV